MRTSTEIKALVGLKHFKPIAIVYINFGAGFEEVVAGKIRYSSTLNSSGGSLVSLGTDTSTNVSFELSNTNGTYSHYKLNADDLYRLAVKVEFGFDDAGTDQVIKIFEGTITDFTENDKEMTITINCRDYGDRDALQFRYSSGFYENLRIDEWIETLATAAGLSFTTHGYSPTSVPWLWMEDESILQQMIQAAQAENGIIYIDESGVVNYWPPGYWVDFYYVNEQIWADGEPWRIVDNTDFTDLQLKWESKEQYDDIFVTAQPRSIGLQTEVFTLSNTITIPPLTNKAFTCKFSDPVYDQRTVDYVITNSYGNDMSASVTWNGRVLPDPEEDYGPYLYAEHWDMTIANSNATEDAYLSKFTVTGRPLVGGPSIEMKALNNADLHKRVYKVTNPYIQTDTQAQALASMIQNRFKGTPLMKATVSGLKPNPLLQVGDTVQVTSSNSFLTNAPFYVVGISYASPKYDMTLDLIDATEFFASDNYWTINRNMFDNATNTLEGVLFY
jgi:hypothetical protein